MNDLDTRNHGIKNVAARGAVVTVAGQGLRFVIQLAGIVILSRLLGPSTIGLFAVLFVIVAFGEVVRDFGLSSAMIQAKSVTQAQKSNLFWINTAIGIALAIGCATIAAPLSRFYDEPSLTWPCVGVSAVFLLSGLGTQYRAQLTRDLKFTAVTAIDVLSALGGLAVAVVMAVNGSGLWALVAQQVVIAGVATLLNMAAARWRPSLPSRHAETRKLIEFGWHVGCTQLINYASRNVDTVVIGSLFGPAALGIYNRAYQLMTVPINQLSTPATKIAFPVLSRIRDEPRRFDRFVLIGQRALVHLVGLVFVYTLVIAPAGIDMALGAEWEGVAPLYRVLAVGALAQAASFATYWVFLAYGKTREVLKMTLFTRSVLIAAVIVGALFSVFGVAVAYTVVILLTWPFCLYVLHRTCPEAPTYRMFYQPLLLYVVYGFAGLCAYVTTFVTTGNLLKIAISGVVYVAVLTAIVGIVKPFRRDLQEIAALRHLVRRGGDG